MECTYVHMVVARVLALIGHQLSPGEVEVKGG